MQIGHLAQARKPASAFQGAILRAILFVLALGGLAAAGALLIPVGQTPGAPAKAAVSARPEAKRPEPVATPARPQQPAPRVVYAGPAGAATAPIPLPGAATGLASAAASPPAVLDAPSSAPPPIRAGFPPDTEATTIAASPSSAATPTAEPRAALAAASPLVSPVQPVTRMEAAVPEPADEPASPDGLIDLNTGSLARLNALNGAGLIGRAIVRGRPYASTEDLVAKRILNKSTFDRIRDQITVR